MTSHSFRWARRSFLSKLGAGASVFGAVFGGGVAPAAAAPGGRAGAWEPARHREDDWFDQTPAQHRFFFDTTTAAGLGAALLFANNYFAANKSGYGLIDTDLAVIVCVRHKSTPFAYDDAMWAKYAAPLSERSGFVDPRTQAPATLNVYRSADYGASVPNNGITIDSLLKRGVRLAVCDTSTRGYAGVIAAHTGAKVDDIYKELTGHLVPNAHMVPAGIVAVNRAQERGYSFAYTG
jgi:intracellular sulfur oxidation DsrE/DsrF family protein